MPYKFARDTKVTVEKSQLEIQRLLKKYGASKYAIDWNTNDILFQLRGFAVKLHIKKPNRNDQEIQFTPQGNARTFSGIQKRYAQAERQMWRVLILFLKAALESVEMGVLSLEQAFLPHLILPNGQTMTEYVIPQLSNIDIFHLPQIGEGKTQGDSQ